MAAILSRPQCVKSTFLCSGDVSLHLTSSPDEFWSGYEFVDGVHMVINLQWHLFYKLDDD